MTKPYEQVQENIQLPSLVRAYRQGLAQGLNTFLEWQNPTAEGLEINDEEIDAPYDIALSWEFHINVNITFILLKSIYF